MPLEAIEKWVHCNKNLMALMFWLKSPSVWCPSCQFNSHCLYNLTIPLADQNHLISKLQLEDQTMFEHDTLNTQMNNHPMDSVSHTYISGSSTHTTSVWIWELPPVQLEKEFWSKSRGSWYPVLQFWPQHLQRNARAGVHPITYKCRVSTPCVLENSSWKVG